MTPHNMQISMVSSMSCERTTLEQQLNGKKWNLGIVSAMAVVSLSSLRKNVGIVMTCSKISMMK